MLELHLQYCFYNKIQKKNHVWRNKKDLVEIIKKLCEMKQVKLIDGRVCIDHIHMYIAIPPKISVSEFMSYLKGKSALMLFDRHPEYRNKWGDRHFWARGYYVSTVGNVNDTNVFTLRFVANRWYKLMDDHHLAGFHIWQFQAKPVLLNLLCIGLTITVSFNKVILILTFTIN